MTCSQNIRMCLEKMTGYLWYIGSYLSWDPITVISCFLIVVFSRFTPLLQDSNMLLRNWIQVSLEHLSGHGRISGLNSEMSVLLFWSLPQIHLNVCWLC